MSTHENPLQSEQEGQGQTVGDAPIAGNVPTATDAIELAPQNSRSSKRKISKAWDHFTKINNDGVLVDVNCNHCFKRMRWDSRIGTSSLLKHITRGACTFRLPEGETDEVVEPYVFDQMACRKLLARMTVRHNYAFNMCDHELFEEFCAGLNPDFIVPCRNTLKSDVVEWFADEKTKVYDFLDNINSKVSLTTDLWTAEHSNDSYCVLTVHFIDESWKLHKRILAFKYLSYPHDGDKLFNFMKDRILEWNLDKRVSSVVVDNAGSNTSMIRMLKEWLNSKALLPLSGDLLHVRCSAHILNLIVQDGLKVLKNLIKGIRCTVRYLERTPSALEKFGRAKQQLRLTGERQVAMDVSTRWNSTYKLLETAIPLRAAFNRLVEMDDVYKAHNFNPSNEEWEIAKVVVGCLKIFFDATRHFSGSKYPTSNVFFPDICEIHLKLLEWQNSNLVYLRVMSSEMKLKFDKYWDDCCLALAIAIVLDPCFKMHIVKFYFSKIYGDAAPRHIGRVQRALENLYVSYGGGTIAPSGSQASSSTTHGEGQSFSEFDAWYQDVNASRIVQKSELEVYLEEPKTAERRGFDVLNYWKANSVAARFPTLGRIARDILAVPATTVASEAAFSVSGRVLDESRSSLAHDVVEALVVGNDWLLSDQESRRTVMGGM